MAKSDGLNYTANMAQPEIQSGSSAASLSSAMQPGLEVLKSNSILVSAANDFLNYLSMRSKSDDFDINKITTIVNPQIDAANKGKVPEQVNFDNIKLAASPNVVIPGQETIR